MRWDRVNQDPEAPLVHQDLLDQAPVTAQRFLTWRAQDSQTGVLVVLQASQALLALLGLLGLQWHWEPVVQ